MFKILVSFFTIIQRWLLKGPLYKFVIFTSLYLFCMDAFEYVGDLLPDMTSLQTAFHGLPSFAIYLLLLFRVDVGIGMILSAYATRFIIRRIPIIG